MCEMPLFDMCRELIEKLLKDLKVTKSPGPDGIHSTVLKELAAELLVPLLKISPILYTQPCVKCNRFIIYTTDQTTLCICNEYLI